MRDLDYREVDEVGARDIADTYGWSRWKAWRYLVALERTHGAAVVKRRGRRLYTTRAGLEHVAAALPPDIDPRIERRLRDLEAAVAEHTGRLNGQSSELREFRRKARAWYAVGVKVNGGKKK